MEQISATIWFPARLRAYKEIAATSLVGESGGLVALGAHGVTLADIFHRAMPIFVGRSVRAAPLFPQGIGQTLDFRAQRFRVHRQPWRRFVALHLSRFFLLGLRSRRRVPLPNRRFLELFAGGAATLDRRLGGYGGGLGRWRGGCLLCTPKRSSGGGRHSRGLRGLHGLRRGSLMHGLFRSFCRGSLWLGRIRWILNSSFLRHKTKGGFGSGSKPPPPRQK